MAGYFKRILTPWGTQPGELVEIHEDYSQYVSSARQWNIPPTIPAENTRRGLSGYAKTGTIDWAASIGGIGVKGDGTTGLYSRTISVVPQAMWMAAQFVASAPAAGNKSIYTICTGGAAGSLVRIATTPSATILTNLTTGVGDSNGISKEGGAVVTGNIYTVVAVFPSNLKAEAYFYANGVKYTADASGSLDASFSGVDTYLNEAVGALKRATPITFSSDTVLFTARGLGLIPEALAKDISLNPYILLQPEERQVWVPTGGTSPTVVTLDPAALNLTPQNTQNTAQVALSTTTADFVPQDIQNSVTNNLTAVAFDFVAHDITAENASTATVTLDTATFDFVANDSQNALQAELSTATCDFVANDAQALTAHSLDVCTFDFVGQDAQNTLGLLLENALFDFVARSITAGDPLAPTTGRATNMMLMGVGN